MYARDRSWRELYDFGNRLRTERTRAGMTQQELAIKVGTYQGRISLWERAKQEPERKNLMATEEALGITDGRLSVALGYRFENSFGWAITYEHEDSYQAVQSDRDIPREWRAPLAALIWRVKRGDFPEEFRPLLECLARPPIERPSS